MYLVLMMRLVEQLVVEIWQVLFEKVVQILVPRLIRYSYSRASQIRYGERIEVVQVIESVPGLLVGMDVRRAVDCLSQE
jgi:hypothetical protein